MSLKVIVAGMGVQGAKRQRAAGKSVVATVDPIAENVEYKDVRDVPLEVFDAAILCIPDSPKVDLIDYLLSNKKHVLIEKPLFAGNDRELETLTKLAEDNNVVCYTAYNHRFEPHFIRMRDLIQSDALGEIYSLRMFYGNGTARLVRDSEWRDSGAGVLPDLGSHLLDTLRFWFGENYDAHFEIRGAFNHENKSFDHVIIGSNNSPAIQLEMTMLSWRNHFTCDVLAEKGSAHIESLCKWGPSTFIHRTRVLPSGRPPEETETLEQDDPTWDSEYDHFINLCQNKGGHNLENDIWINRTLRDLAISAGVAVNA
jgi:scyllo-inositol 2-dehydrogenase (NADP+)